MFAIVMGVIGFFYLHPTIQANACRQWFFAEDLDSPIAVIKTSRNTHTHYDTYSDDEKVMVMLSEGGEGGGAFCLLVNENYGWIVVKVSQSC
ncbi:hypothetical protein C5167_011847 [Papaver somniferum]|uniref:Uncharacterized protein n=1 Tax=Papaver somniferum TaxID=3469 RepID=A0A4Y7IZ13_PAPSO|nr:hypothetical protein C5167_011847 [Papaver somniferum]